MANINSVITYNANLSPAQAQIKALTGQIAGLTAAFNALDKSALKAQRSVAATFTANIGQIGGFTAQTVKATNAVETFGRQVAANKLTMREYFREAITGYTNQNSMLRRLAEQQVRYQQSIAVPIGGGQATILTPQSINAASSAAQLASQRFSIFNQLINGGATAMLNWGKNTQWAGRQLMVGFTLPLALFAGAMSKQFRELDKELTRFQKVYGSDLGNSISESTQRMRDQVQQLAYDISSAYGIAAKETAALAADIAATGAEGEALMSSIQQTTRLAVLGEVDRQEAMKATLSLQSAFRMNTDELAESINFLNAVENQTSATLEDLSTAIPKVGPVIRSLGGDVKDLATLLVAMREGGIPAAEAANALKSGLASLINPTKQAAAVARQFGVDLVGIVEANQGQLMPTIYAMQSALSGLDSFSRSRIIEQIFGKYQFARITALFDNIGRTGSQTQQVIELATKSSAELAAVANGEIKTLTESTAVKFQRTLEQLKNSLMPIGQTLTETLIPVLEKVGEGIKMFSTFFSALPDSVKGLAKWGVALTALAGPVIMLVGLFGNLVANGLKFGMMIVRLGAKMAGIKVERFQLLDQNVMAAKLGVDNLTTAFTTQEVAMKRLVGVLSQYEQSLNRLAIREPALFIPGAVPVTRAAPPIRRQKGSTAPEKVPGGYGGGDRIPALLEPGESVITKEATAKFWPVIEAMNRGNLPGFNRGAIFLGMPRGYKDIQGAKQVRQTLSTTNVEATTGRFAKLPVTDIGTKATSIGGRSSSIPGVNGIYEQGGNKYVVKTHDTADSALAEVRGTQLTRDIFGLDTPVQELIKIKHPVTGDVIFAVRSPYEAKFASSTGVIDEKNFFGQALAAIVRRDKDLQPDNLYGNIVTDVGQAFVANKASQPRIIGGELPGVAEQTATNFLMSKGGAKKWFAETTAPLARTMSEDDYVRGFQTTIAEAARKARASIDNLPYMTKEEKVMYSRIIDDLDEAARIDWRAVYQSHRGITPEVKKPPTAAALAKKEALEAEKARQRGDMARWEYGLPLTFNEGGMVPGKYSRGRIPLIRPKVEPKISSTQRTHTTPIPITTTNPKDIPERTLGAKRGQMAKDLAAAGVPVELLTDSWIHGPFNQGLKRGVSGSRINNWLKNLNDNDLGPAYKRAGIDSNTLKAALTAAFKNDEIYTQETFGKIIEKTAKKVSRKFQPKIDSFYIPKPSYLKNNEEFLRSRGFETYRVGSRRYIRRIGEDSGEMASASYPLTEVKGFNEGGIIPGYGGGDIVPAYLEPGEFVIRKEVTRENKAFLENINSGKYRKFQLGGMSGNEPALLEPGEFVVNSDASAKYAPILTAMNRGTIGRYENGRDDVTMRPGYNPNDPKYSSPDKSPTGGQHQGHIFGAPVAPGIPAFGKNLRIGGQAVFWHQDFWKMVTAAENQLANVLAMSAGNRARFMESLSIVGPQFNASQQQIDRIMLAVTNGFMQHEDDVTLYQAALKNLGQRISTGAASVTGSMAGLIKQVESIKITGYSAAEAQAVERRLIAEYQRILSTPGQLAETARIAIAKQLQTVQQQMTATGIATTQMTASLASNIQASAARPFPTGTLVPAGTSPLATATATARTTGPAAQLAAAEQNLIKAVQLRENIARRVAASEGLIENMNAERIRILNDTKITEEKRRALLQQITSDLTAEEITRDRLREAEQRADKNVITAKERAARAWGTTATNAAASMTRPGGIYGSGGYDVFGTVGKTPPKTPDWLRSRMDQAAKMGPGVPTGIIPGIGVMSKGPTSSMQDPMERAMRGQGLMNIAFMGSMAVGSLGALGVASEDAASKLMLLSTALMALPMLQMINPKGMVTNFLGLRGLGERMQGAGMSRAAAAGTGISSNIATRGLNAGPGAGLFSAGARIGALGGPKGIALAMGITAIVAAYMLYKKAADEARERAIASFEDPAKSAEYFGETIDDLAAELENRAGRFKVGEFVDIDPELRKIVGEEYAPLIERLKYSQAEDGARQLSLAYNNMLINGLSAENAQATLKAIAAEAGTQGGLAYSEAFSSSLLNSENTEEAIQKQLDLLNPENNKDLIERLQAQIPQLETRASDVANQDALSRWKMLATGIVNITKISVPQLSMARMLFSGDPQKEGQEIAGEFFRGFGEVWTSFTGQLFDSTPEAAAADAAQNAVDQAKVSIEELKQLSADAFAASTEDFMKAYEDAPEKVIEAIRQSSQWIDASTENVDILKQKLMELSPVLAGLIATLENPEEIALFYQLLTVGADPTRFFNENGFNTGYAQQTVDTIAHYDELEKKNNEIFNSMKEDTIEFIDNQIKETNKGIRKINDYWDSWAKVTRKEQRQAQKDYDQAQKRSEKFIDAKQDEIEAIEDTMDARREEFDEKMQALQDEKDLIDESTDKYIDSLNKRKEADSFYAQQRKTSLGALQKLASGDVFGFLQDREQMSSDAQTFSYDQMIAGIEDRRDLEIDAIDETMEKERRRQEEWEKAQRDKIDGINDLIDAERDLMEERTKAHEKDLRQFEKRQKTIETNRKLELKDERTKLANLTKAREKAEALEIADYEEMSTLLGKEYEDRYGKQILELQKAQYYIRLNALLEQNLSLPAEKRRTEEELMVDAFTDAFGQRPGPAQGGMLSQGIIETLRDMGMFPYGPGQGGQPLAGGGRVTGPGGPKSDVIPAMLSNGEYVIQASSVKKYGTDLMNTINAGKYAYGGYVGSIDAQEARAQGNVYGGIPRPKPATKYTYTPGAINPVTPYNYPRKITGYPPNLTSYFDTNRRYQDKNTPDNNYNAHGIYSSKLYRPYAQDARDARTLPNSYSGGKKWRENMSRLTNLGLNSAEFFNQWRNLRRWEKEQFIRSLENVSINQPPPTVIERGLPGKLVVPEDRGPVDSYSVPWWLSQPKSTLPPGSSPYPVYPGRPNSNDTGREPYRQNAGTALVNWIKSLFGGEGPKVEYWNDPYRGWVPRPTGYAGGGIVRGFREGGTADRQEGYTYATNPQVTTPKPTTYYGSTTTYTSPYTYTPGWSPTPYKLPAQRYGPYGVGRIPRTNKPFMRPEIGRTADLSAILASNYSHKLEAYATFDKHMEYLRQKSGESVYVPGYGYVGGRDGGKKWQIISSILSSSSPLTAGARDRLTGSARDIPTQDYWRTLSREQKAWFLEYATTGNTNNWSNSRIFKLMPWLPKETGKTIERGLSNKQIFDDRGPIEALLSYPNTATIGGANYAWDSITQQWVKLSDVDRPLGGTKYSPAPNLPTPDMMRDGKTGAYDRYTYDMARPDNLPYPTGLGWTTAWDLNTRVPVNNLPRDLGSWSIPDLNFENWNFGLKERKWKPVPETEQTRYGDYDSYQEALEAANKASSGAWMGGSIFEPYYKGNNKWGIANTYSPGYYANGGIVKASNGTYISADRAETQASGGIYAGGWKPKPTYSGGTPTYYGGYTSANTQATQTSGYKSKIWKQPKIKTGGGFLGDMMFEGLRSDFADFINTTILGNQSSELQNLVGRNISGNRSYGQRSEIDQALGNALFGLNFIPGIGIPMLGTKMGAKTASLLGRSMPRAQIRTGMNLGPAQYTNSQGYFMQLIEQKYGDQLIGNLVRASDDPAITGFPAGMRLESHLGPSTGALNVFGHKYALTEAAKNKAAIIGADVGDKPIKIMSADTVRKNIDIAINAVNKSPDNPNVLGANYETHPYNVIRSLSAVDPEFAALSMAEKREITSFLASTDFNAKSAKNLSTSGGFDNPIWNDGQVNMIYPSTGRFGLLNTMAHEMGHTTDFMFARSGYAHRPLRYIPEDANPLTKWVLSTQNSMKNANILGKTEAYAESNRLRAIKALMEDAGVDPLLITRFTREGGGVGPYSVGVSPGSYANSPLFKISYAMQMRRNMKGQDALFDTRGFSMRQSGIYSDLIKSTPKWLWKMLMQKAGRINGYAEGGLVSLDENLLRQEGVSLNTAKNAVSHINNGGWPDNLTRLAFAIAMRESNGNVNAFSRYSPTNSDTGLFQVNEAAYGKQPWFDLNRLKDGSYNASVAYKYVSQGGTHFLPWALTPGFDGTNGWDWSYYANSSVFAPGSQARNETIRRTKLFWDAFKGSSGGNETTDETNNNSNKTDNQNYVVPERGLLGRLSLVQRGEGANTGGVPAPDGSYQPPVNTGNPDGVLAVAFAKQQLGEPYVADADGPDQWDCSGLTAAAYNVGVPDGYKKYSLVSYSTSQAERLKINVRRTSGTPGDGSMPEIQDNFNIGDILYFTNTGIGSSGKHVSMYAGNGQIIEAGDPVQMNPLNNDWNKKYFNFGGTPIAKFASGGFISGPGGPRSDVIPAMLSNGEYVVKASSVAKYGKGFMDKLNSGQLNASAGGFISKFANGGMVGVGGMPSFNMPEMANTSVGMTNNNYGGNTSSNNSRTSVKVVINGASNKGANAIANQVISMINSANSRRDHSRSI